MGLQFSRPRYRQGYLGARHGAGNQPLFDYFRDRQIYLLEPDEDRTALKLLRPALRKLCNYAWLTRVG